MTRIIFLLSLGLLATGCTAPDRTVQTLQAQGFSHIEIGGYDFFSCGEHDTFSTHFTATNPLGQRVEGTVCCGLVKSCTVRF